MKLKLTRWTFQTDNKPKEYDIQLSKDELEQILVDYVNLLEKEEMELFYERYGVLNENN